MTLEKLVNNQIFATMKTDFSINIHVDLGVTPELAALVASIISRPQPQPQMAKEPSAREKTEEKPSVEVVATETPTQEAEQTEEKAEEPKPEAPAEPKAKELTAQDVRDAMHKTRQRIEGENYKEETEGELYKKYHRQLTSWFKNTAALLGADKPSTLPSDKIQDFINECDRLRILEDGSIGIPQAF